MKNKLTAAVLAASLLASAGAAVAAPAAGGMAENGSKPAGKCNENPQQIVVVEMFPVH